MFEPITQDDFGGGIFRGRRAPGDSLYDAVNALISDEREPFRRGGSAYKSGSNADGALLGLWDGHTSAGQRTVFWSATSPYVLAADDSALVDLGTLVPVPWASGVEIGGLVFVQGPLASGDQTEVVYGGSRKAANYTTGTITYTAGSAVVTGSGTSWLANADAGMILARDVQGSNVIGIVKSVDSNTQITLTTPAGAADTGVTYALLPLVRYVPISGYDNPRTRFHAVAGRRLIRVLDNRAYFSFPADHANFLSAGVGSGYVGRIEDVTTDYHELPRSSLIVGADSIEDTLILFTTEGVWAISNMNFDPLDDVGNQQHQVAQISQDVILWGEAGIAGWGGALLVPAVDDVFVLGPGGAPVAVSESIRPLYREYVEAGYKPGTAAVHRGHYFLPILNSSNVLQDVLVCRLDLSGPNGRRPAWTRWANHAAGGAYAVRVGADTREPKLLGINGLRVTDLTGCFDPEAGNKADADGTGFDMTLISRDIKTGPGMHKNFVANARIHHTLTDAATDDPTIAVSTAVGRESAAFTAAAATRNGGESDGTDYAAFRINRDAESIRVKVVVDGPAADATLHRLELEVEPAGW